MSTLGRLNWFLAEAERILAREIEEARNNETENSFASKLLISSWRNHIEDLKTKIDKEHSIEH